MDETLEARRVVRRSIEKSERGEEASGQRRVKCGGVTTGDNAVHNNGPVKRVRVEEADLGARWRLGDDDLVSCQRVATLQGCGRFEAALGGDEVVATG